MIRKKDDMFSVEFGWERPSRPNEIRPVKPGKPKPIKPGKPKPVRPGTPPPGNKTIMPIDRTFQKMAKRMNDPNGFYNN